MKAHLLFRDSDLELDLDEPPHAADLVQDLEIDTLLDAMAAGDPLVRRVSRAVLLDSLTEPGQVLYRQAILNDSLHEQDTVRALYDLAAEGIAAEKSVFRSFFADQPQSLLERSVRVLELFVGVLKELRRVGDTAARDFRSEGFSRFFTMLATELDDVHFHIIDAHLKQLRFRDGLLLSARLGAGNQGIDYVLRRPREDNKSFFNRGGLRKPTFSYTVPDRDEGGSRALSELRDRGLNEVANAAAQSADHVLSFFWALRRELAFYIGCLTLHRRLSGNGEPVCYPAPKPVGARQRSARGLYDVCLSLRLDTRVVGNTVEADGATLVMVTGANQGGKSTFLRSVGLAQLMMGAGMFVAAEAFTASTTRGVFTHYKREEDDTMASGKFTEELARMSGIADHIAPGALLLCNESFASTNEREGSEIAHDAVRALIDAGVTVVFVTHLYDLAHGLWSGWSQRPDTALFLRAERDEGGHRTFRLGVGEPLPTSYGQDLYERIFGTAPPRPHRRGDPPAARAARRGSWVSRWSTGSCPRSARAGGERPRCGSLALPCDLRGTGCSCVRIEVAAAGQGRAQRVVEVVAQRDASGDVEPGDLRLAHAVQVHDQGAQRVAVRDDQRRQAAPQIRGEHVLPVRQQTDRDVGQGLGRRDGVRRQRGVAWISGCTA